MVSFYITQGREELDPSYASLDFVMNYKYYWGNMTPNDMVMVMDPKLV